MKQQRSLRVIDSPPSFQHPVSQICTQGQFEGPAYAFWCRKIRETPRPHRKQWEFCYILHALASLGALAPANRGFGYGVGQEPLPAVMASYGCEVLATDLDPASAQTAGWSQTNQHATSKEALNARAICDPVEFDGLVSLQNVDMKDIPHDLKNFDFTWSACALEHLGSLDEGCKFIERTLTTLRPGGIAIHTTELNCSSDDETIEHGGTVLFRRKDIIALCQRLAAQGHEMTLNLNMGNLPLDHYVDHPPYNPDKHLKLRLEEFVTTSIGLIVRVAY
jgi:Methyltransferase domain